MVQDGLPAVLLLTPEARAEAWRIQPPRAIPLYSPIPKSEDADTAAFRARVEAERRQKSLNQIARMKNRFALKAVDHSCMRWDSRRNKFVADVQSAAPKSAPAVKAPRCDGAVKPKGELAPVGAVAVTKDNARTLAKAAGVWKPEYEKLTGGLLVMTIRNRLRNLK
jgi:hypothetical protein